jgi:predicted transcriptional regulator
MEVHFTPEQEAELTQVAGTEGVDPEAFVKRAALRLLDDARFRAAVSEGIAQADRGELVEEKEVDALFEQMLRSFEPLNPNTETIAAMKGARRGDLIKAGKPHKLLRSLNAGR